MLISERGIVLSRKKVADSDVIVTLLMATQGKIRAYANGARYPKSRFASATQPFVEGDISLVHKKDLSTLSDIAIVNARAHLRNDLNKLFYGTYMLELIELSTIEGDFIKGLFGRLSGALNALETTDNLTLLKVVYDLKIIEIMGFRPVFNACSHCGAQQRLTPLLSALYGGVLCENCLAQGIDYTVFAIEDLKWINSTLKMPFSAIQKAAVNDKMILSIDKWLNKFIELHVIRKPLKSINVIRTLNT